MSAALYDSSAGCITPYSISFYPSLCPKGHARKQASEEPQLPGSGGGHGGDLSLGWDSPELRQACTLR